ncbi:hypothetical protein ACH5RR_028074 [Cinchona calisaya]|uniref:Thioredoxin domain-containing protein n=1 Tax=Cinchona calisaya TaxID=153742 RepID=A0ABD2YNX1_9GENT
MAGVLETITVPRAAALPSLPWLRSPAQHSPAALFVKSEMNSFFSFVRLSLKLENVPAVKDDTWQSLVLDCDSPVLVEFWAPWCGPCRIIHPVIDELAKEYAGKLKCYKVNTDDSPGIATRYGIRSIPTVMVFKNGEKKDTVIGAVPKQVLNTCIEKFL